MKISKYNRRFVCKHCGSEYTPYRSNQKFCTNSCRSSNHQMNKPKQLKGVEVKRTPVESNPTPQKSVGYAFLGSAGANATTQLLEKFGGVHNSDILKKIDELKKVQNTISPNDQEMLYLLRKIYKMLLDQKNKDKYWMLNI